MLFKEERLNRKKHFDLVGGFVCGADDPLSQFLSDKSFDYDEGKYGHTYLLRTANEPRELVAYYTLKANGIQSYSSETEEYNSTPVVEIARLAVRHDLHRIGIGRTMFYEHILPKIKEVSLLIAVKAIIVFVDGDNVDGIGYYESLGFIKADKDVQKKIRESFNESCELYVLQMPDG